MSTGTAPHRTVDAGVRPPPSPTGRPEQDELLVVSAELERRAAGHAGASVAGARHFLRHFGEMFLAMMVGMMVLGRMDSGILSAFGTSVSRVRDSAPEAFALVMALNMTIGMTVWMRYRRHSWAMCGEMGGAMFFPAIVALILFWCSVIHTGSVGGVEMGAMVPAMLAVMMFRRTEYSQPVCSHARKRSAKAEAGT
jgi:hypothetical protein